MLVRLLPPGDSPSHRFCPCTGAILVSVLVGILLLTGCQDASRTSTADPPVSQQVAADDSSDDDSADDPAKVSPVEVAEPTESTRKNRLARETSPYLLQHAENPVDWYPWGEEALNRARQENKLIFLSIGYSSCHWCHVMESESFMDREIADFLNQHFICIKVDREERPDIDSIYMTAVQFITGRGGWPLSAFLTPDSKPFIGGTYYPARDGDRPGAMGFLTVIQHVSRVWQEQEQEVRASAEKLSELIVREMSGGVVITPIAIEAEMITRARNDLSDQFDPQYGGFGYDPARPQIPKFPQVSNLFFLSHLASSDDRARDMLVTTLDHLAMGGIRDHLGGGYHRYSVDRFWHIPHFEKMLYDNGQLASVYAEAFALTGNPEYRLVLEEMVEFLNREMSHTSGGFYSAIDADSEHEEGKFYRWEREQWDAILGAESARLFASVYAESGAPNFEHDYYVPLLTSPLTQLAEARETNWAAFQEQLRPWRQQLFVERAKRVRPMTDTKVLSGWNGLMIRGLADAGRLLNEPAYVARAAQAAQFVLDHMRNEQGQLYRTFSANQPRLNAYLDDYAFLADGLIALHRATDDDMWLRHADEITAKQIELFWDESSGGFFYTAENHESLLVRGKQFVDGAVPSGNSVAAQNLIYLARQLSKPDYVPLVEKTLHAASPVLERSPAAAPRLVLAAAELLSVDADRPGAKP